jgi:hypothetical protein
MRSVDGTLKPNLYTYRACFLALRGRGGALSRGGGGGGSPLLRV